jgi:hypothetical protein
MSLSYWDLDTTIRPYGKHNLRRDLTDQGVEVWVAFLDRSAFGPHSLAQVNKDISSTCTAAVLQLFLFQHHIRGDITFRRYDKRFAMTKCALESVHDDAGTVLGWFLYLYKNYRPPQLDDDGQAEGGDNDGLPQLEAYAEAEEEKDRGGGGGRNNNNRLGQKDNASKASLLGLQKWFAYFIRTPLRMQKEFSSGNGRMRKDDLQNWRHMVRIKEKSFWFKIVVEILGRPVFSSETSDGFADDPYDPMYPSNVFSMQNAVLSKRRLHPDHVHSKLPVQEEIAKHMYDAYIPCPSIPTNATSLYPYNATDQYLRMHSFPHIAVTIDETSQDYLRRRSVHTELDDAKFRIYYETVHAGGIVQDRLSNLENFMDYYSDKMKGCTNRQEVVTVRKMGFDEYERVMCSFVPHGFPYRSLIEYEDRLLAATGGSMCLPNVVITPSSRVQKLDVFGEYMMVNVSVLEVLMDVSATHKQVLINLAACMDAARCVKNQPNNLGTIVLQLGPPGAGKTFVHSVVKMLVINAKRVDHESFSAMYGDEEIRGYIFFQDEMDPAQFGIDISTADMLGLWKLIKGQRTSANTMKEGRFKSMATSSGTGTLRAFADKDAGRGEVGTNLTEVAKYGMRSINGNPNRFEGTKPVVQRSLYLHYPTTSRPDRDAIQAIQSALAVPEKHNKFKQYAIYHKRNQLLIMHYFNLEASLLIPSANTDSFSVLFNLFSSRLLDMGFDEPRMIRNFEKLMTFCRISTLQRAIMLVFDMGIGGPDPADKFHPSHLWCLVPHLVIPPAVTLFNLEFLDLYRDPVDVMVAQCLAEHIFQYDASHDTETDKREVLGTDGKVLYRVDGDYLVIKSYFKTPSMGYMRQCCELSNTVYANLDDKPDPRDVFASLANMTNHIIPKTVRRNNKTSTRMQKGWDQQTDNLEVVNEEKGGNVRTRVNLAGIDLCIHKKIIRYGHTEALYDVIREVIPLNFPEMPFVRGKMKDHNRFVVGDAKHVVDTTVEDEINAYMQELKAKEVERDELHALISSADTPASVKGQAIHAREQIQRDLMDLSAKIAALAHRSASRQGTQTVPNPRYADPHHVEQIKECVPLIKEFASTFETNQHIQADGREYEFAMRSHLIVHGFATEEDVDYHYGMHVQKLVNVYRRTVRILHKYSAQIADYRQVLQRAEAGDVPRDRSAFDDFIHAWMKVCLATRKLFRTYARHKACPEVISMSRVMHLIRGSGTISWTPLITVAHAFVNKPYVDQSQIETDLYSMVTRKLIVDIFPDRTVTQFWAGNDDMFPDVQLQQGEKRPRPQEEEEHVEYEYDVQEYYDPEEEALIQEHAIDAVPESIAEEDEAKRVQVSKKKKKKTLPWAAFAKKRRASPSPTAQEEEAEDDEAMEYNEEEEDASEPEPQDADDLENLDPIEDARKEEAFLQRVGLGTEGVEVDKYGYAVDDFLARDDDLFDESSNMVQGPGWYANMDRVIDRDRRRQQKQRQKYLAQQQQEEEDESDA